MNEIDKELIYSEAVKAGKRIYYFDVKQSRNGDRYVSITESKKIVEGNPDNPRISYEKHKLFLYKEDYEKFVKAMLHVVDVAKTGNVPSQPETSEPSSKWVYKPKDTVVAQKEEVAEEPVAEIVEPAPAPAPSAAPVPESKPAPIVTEKPVSSTEDDNNAYKIDLDF